MKKEEEEEARPSGRVESREKGKELEDLCFI